jgi:hypothetical protein
MRIYNAPSLFEGGLVGCKSYGINQILVGLNRIGVTGLVELLGSVDQRGLEDRDSIVAYLLEALAREHYIPDRQLDDFRVALWREYLRYRGEDMSEFFSEVEVTVRGGGEDLDRFVEMTRSVFAEFELKPIITLEPEKGDGPYPQLCVRDEAIIRGNLNRPQFKQAVRKSFTDW